MCKFGQHLINSSISNIAIVREWFGYFSFAHYKLPITINQLHLRSVVTRQKNAFGFKNDVWYMNSNKSKLDKKEWLYLKELNGVQHHFLEVE